MSRLLFAPLDEAFYLRSDNIKDTQIEIDNLKKIISESQLVKRQPNPKEQISKPKELYADKVTANFENGAPSDIDMMKVIQHPRFDDIVKNYLLVKYPELKLKPFNQKPIKENFGSNYSTTFCSNIKNYTLFFIFSLVVYLFLEKILKK